MKYISARKADNKVMNNVSQEERNKQINVNGGKAKTKYFAKCSSKGQMRTCRHVHMKSDSSASEVWKNGTHITSSPLESRIGFCGGRSARMCWTTLACGTRGTWGPWRWASLVAGAAITVSSRNFYRNGNECICAIPLILAWVRPL